MNEINPRKAPAWILGGVHTLEGYKCMHTDREFFADNLLVWNHFIIEMILVDRPRAMEVLNSLLRVALYLPSSIRVGFTGPRTGKGFVFNV